MQHKNYSNIQRACNFRLILQTPHYRLVFLSMLNISMGERLLYVNEKKQQQQQLMFLNEKFSIQRDIACLRLYEHTMHKVIPAIQQFRT